jgi:DNA polymerase alpha subunit A
VKDEERADLTTDEIKQLYGSSQSLLQLISCTMQDAAYILRLMCELNVLPLALQITKIAGMLYVMYNLASAVGVVCSV